MESGTLKACSQCGKEKPLIDFPPDKTSDGRRANCRDCKNAASKQTYKDTKDDPVSVARRIIKSCKERERERLAKFIKRRDELDYIPDVELNDDLFDIDTNWVIEQRDRQNNKCFYTGKEMIWSTGLIDEVRRINPLAVTVDRLDSTGNYIKSNCVLSIWWANCSKNSGTIDELIYFSFEVVRKYIKDIEINKLIKID